MGGEKKTTARLTHSIKIKKMKKNKENYMTIRYILTGLFLFLYLGIAEAQSMAVNEPQYNILLFTADDLHAESLRTYGSQSNMTPQLDAFAKSGFLFERAHVNAAICGPSRAIIATGQYGHNSGAVGFRQANPGTPTLMTVLRSAGFNCGILGKVSHSTPVKGFRWDYHFDQKDLGNGRSPSLYYQRSKEFFEQCKSENKPFYFMVNSHDPHRPYCNPEKLTEGAEMPSKVYAPDEVEVPGFLPDLPGVRKELAMYQNSTRRLDDTFGKVMQALEESGLADSTLIVFMTDNGIAVPFAKCNTYFHSTHTPMILRFPGLTQAGQRDTTNFVSGIDLMPTFLDFLKISEPDKQDGQSFLPLLKGEKQIGRDLVYTQIDMDIKENPVPMRCIQNKKFGYIYNPFSDGNHWYSNNNEGQSMRAMEQAAKNDPAVAARVQLFRYRVPEEFYDLEKDPNCLNNLIKDPKYRSEVVKMKKNLEDKMFASTDPMLVTFQNMDDRKAVDAAIVKTYGELKAKKEN
jgi:N-sulfoglucosamine sulfohydrolase